LLKFEDIKADLIINGIILGTAVSVVRCNIFSDGNSAELTYKVSDGSIYSRMLYRSDESSISVEEERQKYTYDADPKLFSLVSEAYRINLAYLFDPYVAVHISQIEPFPHQISAVYQHMLPQQPLRFVLADDPGAGKTIMSGLFIKELMIRSDVKRCLIVTPGNLAEQWQDELLTKFNLSFEIFTHERRASNAISNVFSKTDLCIARLDTLTRNEDLIQQLKNTSWDLIICDEAHKMSASARGNKIEKTKRYKLGELLSSLTRHFLLLTATPHNGIEADFQLFMSLVDKDRFEHLKIDPNNPKSTNLTSLMRRLLKEDLLKFNGKPLFPERKAYTVNYELSDGETALYNNVTKYVQEEFNRAQDRRLTGLKRNSIGFALTLLQRRLASSPEAIYQSLRRRKERLQLRLKEIESSKTSQRLVNSSSTCYYNNGIDILDAELLVNFDELPSLEAEDLEEEIVVSVTAAKSVEELKAEITTLENLEREAYTVKESGVDRKWGELSRLIQDEECMYKNPNQRNKLIIFSEHRDTISYLTDKIKFLLGKDNIAVNIHGGMLREDRKKAEEMFKEDENIQFLIATDAAGEGINLQNSHLMINYDLPWNPNRLEQRFGRIHRIGQSEVCHLWNLVSHNTREGSVFKCLLDKLENVRTALSGKVFDVLGIIKFGEEETSLRELLIEAIRYGDDPNVRQRLNNVVECCLDVNKIKELIDKHSLVDVKMDMDLENVLSIRKDMEKNVLNKLQPYFIQHFFLEAFKQLDGTIKECESGRYQIKRIPDMLRTFSKDKWPILNKYDRICFDKNKCKLPKKVEASLLAHGHPLLDATINFLLERHKDLLKRGTILIDDKDLSAQVRHLFYVEDSVQDGILLPNGKNRIISKHIHFVEFKEDGEVLVINGTGAPYLDYAKPNEKEKDVILKFISEKTFLTTDIERKVLDYAVSNILITHLEEVKTRHLEIIEKKIKAVENRLTDVIQYWDLQSIIFRDGNNQKYTNATTRSYEIKARKDKRLLELNLEKNISSLLPVIVGSAIVIPRALCNILNAPTNEANIGLFAHDPIAIKKIENAGMDAVMKFEKELGFDPIDVSKSNLHYDIQSQKPSKNYNTNENLLRFIEVKARFFGGETITVTYNEILTALNAKDNYILAIVIVHETFREITYLSNPFSFSPDSTVCSINYNINDLKKSGSILNTKTYIGA
jgi:superfamily II DNA or RNA helicase